MEETKTPLLRSLRTPALDSAAPPSSLKLVRDPKVDHRKRSLLLSACVLVLFAAGVAVSTLSVLARKSEVDWVLDSTFWCGRLWEGLGFLFLCVGVLSTPFVERASEYPRFKRIWFVCITIFTTLLLGGLIGTTAFYDHKRDLFEDGLLDDEIRESLEANGDSYRWRTFQRTRDCCGFCTAPAFDPFCEDDNSTIYVVAQTGIPCAKQEGIDCREDLLETVPQYLFELQFLGIVGVVLCAFASLFFLLMFLRTLREGEGEEDPDEPEGAAADSQLWEEYEDPTSQARYYMQVSTGQVVPKCPPNKWLRLIDSSTNKYYYFQTTTGQLQWNNPELSGADGTASARGSVVATARRVHATPEEARKRTGSRMQSRSVHSSVYRGSVAEEMVSTRILSTHVISAVKMNVEGVSELLGPHSPLESSFLSVLEDKKEEDKWAPMTRLNHVFEKTARELPDQLAVQDGPYGYSYQDINAAAERLAAALASAKIPTGSIIGVFLGRGAHVYSTMLGILKHGCAYVPIDPAFPTDRVVFTLQNSLAAAVVTSLNIVQAAQNTMPCAMIMVEDPNFNRAPPPPPPAPVIPTTPKDPYQCGVTPVQPPTVKPEKPLFEHVFLTTSLAATWNTLPNQVSPTHDPRLCYVIYTSGTTGTPKGVLVSQDNALHYVKVLRSLFRTSSIDRVFQGYSTAFDAAFGELWMAFSGGSALVVGTKEMMQSGPDLKLVIRDLQITVLDTTPTNLMIMGDGTDVPTLHTVIVGGEQCTTVVVDKWAPGRRFLNMYGPTETTVSATYGRLRAGQPITIGKPLPGYKLCVLSEDLTEVKAGEEGELCIGGPGVTLGYLGLPQKTSEKFVRLKTQSGEEGERIYRSGDLVHMTANDDVVFLGRADGQVKIRGYRVELEEIESHISAIAGVDRTVVAVQKNKNSGEQELVAFIAETKLGDFNLAAARLILKTKMPVYMVPMAFVRIEVGDIPISPISGKALRNNLPHWSDLDRFEDERRKSSWHGAFPVGSSDTEKNMHTVLTDVLQVGVPLNKDLFDLGFNSVSATKFVSECRARFGYSKLNMRDIYKYSTISKLAAHVDKLQQEDRAMRASKHEADVPPDEPFSIGATVEVVDVVEKQGERKCCMVPRFWTVTFIQGFMFLFGCLISGATMMVVLYLFTIFELEYVIIILCVLPLFAPIYGLIKCLFVKMLVGPLHEGDYPLYSFGYLKFWMHDRFISNPFHQIGTYSAVWGARLLGAKIGTDVYIGTRKFPGNYDLVELGDGVSIEEGALLQTWVVENRILKLRKVKMGNRCWCGTQATVSAGSEMGDRTALLPLSILPRDTITEEGSVWVGSPAKQTSEPQPLVEVLAQLSESPIENWAGGCKGNLVQLMITFLGIMRKMLTAICTIGPLILAVVFIGPYNRAWQRFDIPVLLLWNIPLAVTQQMMAILVLVFEKRVIGGRATAGEVALNSFEYVRRVMTEQVMHDLLFERTRGFAETVFLGGILRMGFGLDIGNCTEVDTSSMPQPDLLHVGPEAMINGGAILGCPTVFAGKMHLCHTYLGKRCFLGNMSVVNSGARLGSDTLLGVMSVASGVMPSGSTWLGSPAFTLPHRKQWQKEGEGEGGTFDPPFAMFCVRVVMNFWKVINAILVTDCLGVLYAVLYSSTFAVITDDDSSSSEESVIDNVITMFLGSAISANDWTASLILVWTGLGALYPFFLVVICAAFKWLMVGRYARGQRAMWSWFIWRTDVVYEVELSMLAALQGLDGTAWMIWIYRLMGVHIGKNVFLFHTTFMEHDLTTIEDDCVVTGGTLQTHLYEDRWYKTGPVHLESKVLIGEKGFVLYDSLLQEGSSLGPHSLIMRGETFSPYTRYFGLPAQAGGTAPYEHLRNDRPVVLVGGTGVN